MKVAVVGASGVLGRALVPLLEAAGLLVQPLSRAVGFDLLTSDIEAFLDGCEAVVHAATAIPSHPSAPGAWDANTRLRTLGTRRLLDAAQAVGVNRYVQQSIVMVYQDGGDRWLDESIPFDASPSRAAIVQPVEAMESLVREADLAWCILRGGQFCGPGTAQDALMIALAAGRLIVPGHGTHYLSPIHPADMASAVVAALNRAPPGAIYNIVAEPLRYADYVDRLASLCASPAPPRDPARPQPPSHRCTAARASIDLAWAPTHSIWPNPIAILGPPPTHQPT